MESTEIQLIEKMFEKDIQTILRQKLKYVQIERKWSFDHNTKETYDEYNDKDLYPRILETRAYFQSEIQEMIKLEENQSLLDELPSITFFQGMGENYINLAWFHPQYEILEKIGKGSVELSDGLIGKIASIYLGSEIIKIDIDKASIIFSGYVSYFGDFDNHGWVDDYEFFYFFGLDTPIELIKTLGKIAEKYGLGKLKLNG